MGQLGLAIGGAVVGGVIGFYVGGPYGAVLGAQLGFTAGMVAGGILFAETAFQEGSRLEDLDITTSTYGKTIPLIYGTKRVGGNVFWATDLIEHRQKQTESGGGKGGGGGKTVTLTYTYTTSFAIGLCAGPMSCVLKVWADGKLIANMSGDGEPLTNEVLNSSPQTNKGSIVLAFAEAIIGKEIPSLQIATNNFRIYLGGDDQEPDPAIVEDVGIDNTPAYRGLCYIVFQDMLLTDFGNRIPQITCLVSHPTCIDAFPSTTIETDTERESGGQWEQGDVFFSDDFKTGAVLDNGKIVHLDLVTHQIIKEVPLDPVGLPVIYANSGNTSFYISRGFAVVFGFTQVLTCDGTIWIVDINTGATVADGGFGSHEKPCGTRFHVQGGNKIYHFGVAGGGQYEVVDVSEVLVPPPPELPIPGVQMSHPNVDVTFSSLGFTSPGLNAFKSAFIRNDGQCWVIYTSGSDSIFVEYSGDGVPTTERSITGVTFNNSGVIYDGAHDAIVGWNSNTATRYSLPDLVLTGTDAGEVAGPPTVITTTKMQRTMPFGGHIIYKTGSSGDERYDIFNMVRITPKFNANDWAGGTNQGLYYSPIDHSLMTDFGGGDDMYWLYLDRGDAGTEPLSDVILDITNRVGLTAADVDVSDLVADHTVHGFLISGQGAAKASIESLMRPYFFDAIETNFIIDFQERGQAAVKSIPEIDLGAASPGTNTTKITENREQEFEKFPAVVSLTYADKDQDDLKNTQIWRRAAEAIVSKTHLSFSLPMVFPNSAARNIVERLGAQLWFQRTKYSTTLTWEHVDLDPGDLVTLNFDGTTLEAFITDLSYGLNGVIQMDFVSENPSVYSRTAVSEDQFGVPAQKVQLLSTPEGIIADMQALRPTDLSRGYYTAAFRRSTSALYSGADFYDSVDQTNWQSLGMMLRSEEAVGGYTVGKLAAPAKGHTIIDRINTLKLKATTGSLSSTTESVMLDGTTNVIVIENSLGVGWEILSFENAVLNIAGTYTIDTLVRGRRGSEAYMADHTFGDRWFIPTTDTIRSIRYEEALLGTNRFHKTIAIGEPSIENAGLITAITPVGRRIRPLSPSVDEGYTNSTGDIVGRWRRKTRGSIFRNASPFDQWQPDFSSISYEVDFINADSTVARTVTQTASANGSVITMPANEFTGNVTLHYDTVDISADSFDGTTFICYQLNDVLNQLNSGRGEPSTIIIDERS